jgi:hypothetical protein
VYAVSLLDSVGINFSKLLISSPPSAFLLGFFLSRPLVWLAGNPLVHRIRLRSFLFAQPMVLLLSVPNERRACRWVDSHHPATAAVAFGWLAARLRALLGGATARGASEGGYTSCLKVDAWTMMVAGLIIPAIITWYQEQAVARRFCRLPAAALNWPGGPGAAEVAAAQAALRAKCHASPLLHGRRLCAIGFVLAATGWLLLDALLL